LTAASAWGRINYGPIGENCRSVSTHDRRNSIAVDRCETPCDLLSPRSCTTRRRSVHQRRQVSRQQRFRGSHQSFAVGCAPHSSIVHATALQSTSRHLTSPHRIRVVSQRFH
jgi:hypothetical protein